jgi:hypothetical protein
MAMANYNRAWLRRNQAGADLAPSMSQTTAPVGDGPIKFAIAINPGLSYRATLAAQVYTQFEPEGRQGLGADHLAFALVVERCLRHQVRVVVHTQRQALIAGRRGIAVFVKNIGGLQLIDAQCGC